MCVQRIKSSEFFSHFGVCNCAFQVPCNENEMNGFCELQNFQHEIISCLQIARKKYKFCRHMKYIDFVRSECGLPLG